MHYVVTWNFLWIGIIQLNDAEFAVYRLTGNIDQEKLDQYGDHWAWRRKIMFGEDTVVLFAEAKARCKKLNEEEQVYEHYEYLPSQTIGD